MKKISALCEIDGTLKIIKRREFDLCISTAPKGRYFLHLEKIYRKRSLNQNAYYWAVVVPIVRDGLFDVGYKLTLEQTHEYLKEEFLRKEIINENTGEIKTINRSTTDFRSQIMDGFKNYENRKIHSRWDFKKIRQQIFKEFKTDIISELNQDILEENEILKKQITQLEEQLLNARRF